MTDPTVVQPSLTVLTKAQIQQAHEYALQILSTVGVRVDSQRACDLFARAVPPAVVEGNRVRIPRELIEWAIHTAPSSVHVYNRSGEPAFQLPGPARFGIGVTALYYQDPETDQVTPFARQHMASLVRLGHVLPSYDLISTVGIVQDVPTHLSDLYATLEMAANTTKPLVILVSDENAFPAVLDLLEHIHGDLASRPFVVPYFNPITPLMINRGTIDKMWVSAERGLPYIYSNYGMSGASAPITPGGTLALLTAELLAGLTLSQLIREGSTVILGNLPAFFDMKGMGSFYDPQSYLVNLCCAEMMDHYRLPHAGTSGSGVGWGADLLASGHQWMNHLLTCIGKVGLAPFVGDNLDSKAFSPAIVVYANEIIVQARMFAGGFSLDEAHVAVDQIAEVGPGGSYLMSDLTLARFRSAYYKSGIFPLLTMEEWQARGCPPAEGLLRKHTRKLLDGAQPPTDHDDLLARGEAFIQAYESRG